MTDWINDLSQDYHAAALRLATLTKSGVQHLLFASIEMFPYEIPLPLLPAARISPKATGLNFL
jgi:hypothetical protein